MQSGHKIVFWILCLALWVYIIIRAVLSPFVFDEATTFLLFVHNNRVFPGQAFWTANNHILNSALTWVSYNLLGPEEWQLRLPNVLAFPVFCFYLARTTTFLESNLSRWTMVLGIFSGHVFIEMFGFSRGYGLSFAALMGALFFVINNIPKNVRGNRWGFYLSLLFMLMANLTLLPVAFALTAMFVFNVWRLKSPKVEIIEAAVFSSVPMALAGVVSVFLQQKEKLYYAATEGLWNGSVASVMDAFWEDSSFGNKAFLFGLLLVLLLLLLIVFRQSKSLNAKLILAVSLFLVPWVFYPLAHLILGIAHPLDRALLYLPFVMFVLLAFLLDALRIPKTIKLVVITVFLFPFVWSSIGRISLKRASAFKWNTEQIPDAFFEKASDLNNGIGGYFLRQKCWEYLNIKSEKKATVLQTEDYPGNTAHYQIVNDYDSAYFTQEYKVILEDANSGLMLFERRVGHGMQTLDLEQFEALDDLKEFQSLLEIDLSDTDNAVSIYLSGEMYSKAMPYRGVVAISALSEKGEQLFFDQIRLRNLYLDYQEPRHLWQSLYYPNLDNASKLKVLLWNVERQEFDFNNVKVTAFELLK